MAFSPKRGILSATNFCLEETHLTTPISAAFAALLTPLPVLASSPDRRARLLSSLCKGCGKAVDSCWEPSNLMFGLWWAADMPAQRLPIQNGSLCFWRTPAAQAPIVGARPVTSQRSWSLAMSNARVRILRGSNLSPAAEPGKAPCVVGP